MRRYVLIALFSVGVGIVVLLAFTYVTLRAQGTPDLKASSLSQSQVGVRTATVFIGDVSIVAEVVEAPEELARGLSGRSTLNDGAGMLFIMPESSTHTFWMPDMHFSLDIIWIDAAWQVVDVSEHATPESYPQTFSPREPAKYVLEVPSGFAHEHHVQSGSKVEVVGL